jgi:uncharacterized protein YndB with AHSA1/START domain
MTTTIRASVELPGIAPERAFAALVDLAAQERWMIATKLYPVESAAPVPEVGSRVAAFTGVGGLGFLDTMVVTAYDPPHQWVVAKDGRLLQGVGTMRVEATAGGSRAIWMNELTPPFGILGRLAARLAGQVAALALQACLRRLARQLQSGALPLAASGSAGPIAAAPSGSAGPIPADARGRGPADAGPR